MKQIPGVIDVHDIHVWSISPELRAMNGHITIDDTSLSQAAVIRTEIEKVVQEQYHVEHTTLQMECSGCDANQLFCQLNDVCSTNQKKDKGHNSHDRQNSK